MIKVVLIDVDNTLLDFNECAKLAMTRVFESYNLACPDNLFAVFAEVNVNLWEQIQRSEIDLEELYRIRWNIIFSKLNLQLDGVKFEHKFLEFLASSVIAVKGAYEMLDYLSKRYILCIASNAPYEQQVKRLQKADMLKYMKHLFISEKIGYEKPNSNFFRVCLEELQDVAPNEVIMIGDSISADINGAKSIGIKTCWYNYNHIQEPAKSGNKADFIIEDLLDVMDIL